jgi:hypothetical protein
MVIHLQRLVAAHGTNPAQVGRGRPLNPSHRLQLGAARPPSDPPQQRIGKAVGMHHHNLSPLSLHLLQFAIELKTRQVEQGVVLIQPVAISGLGGCDHSANQGAQRRGQPVNVRATDGATHCSQERTV